MQHGGWLLVAGDWVALKATTVLAGSGCQQRPTKDCSSSCSFVVASSLSESSKVRSRTSGEEGERAEFPFQLAQAGVSGQVG